ncbi:MFS transporter [Streptomyces thioluteus]|uniref:MFS transporter n=1 Tax=Streptomyces thioluteus TaxID=66431 RepID=A0ABN3WT33_STRTU
MASTPRTPNSGLADLLAEARWSLSQLALAVNRLGGESGLSLRYDQSAVSHWLAGTMPRAQVRPLVVEALSRRLKRPVTHAEAGFGTPASVPEGDVLEGLVDVGRADMDPSRRGVLTAGVYSAALAVPLFPHLTGRMSEPSKARGTVRIGPGEVSTVRTMTERIADILDELGGGHARPMAAAFLVNTVAPYLRASAPEHVRNDMLAAASDLVYLTGWMAMYEREHALGQRYYVKALELAGAAEDHLTYCRTLRGMSLQASNLGHGAKALELADAAAKASPEAGPRLRAFLTGQQAHAAAMTGDRHTAFARLHETETALSKADSRREAIGGYDASAYHFHVSHVLYEVKDLPGSIRAMEESLRHQPRQQRQGRAHSHGLLAQRQFELGHLDAACAAWHAFLDDYVQLATSRGDEHFATMRRRIAPHGRARAVRELARRADEVARAKAV